jgi:SPP1 gp7 family putative phage head morphogenesis protein
MTDEQYWAQRMAELEEKWNKKCRQELEAELIAYYRQALEHIRKDVNDLYARFARDNELTYVEASQLLQGSEYRVWRMDIQDYLKQYRDTGSAEILRELNTLAMRSRITRLDKLYSETLVHLADLTKKTEDRVDRFLPTAYKDFYYYNLYNIGQKAGLQSAVTAVDDKQVLDILKTPWSDKNYSQRIWKNNAKLAQTIQQTIVQATHRGTSIDTLSRLVSRRMDVGVSDARRLVRTELNFSENRAAYDSIKDAGMKYYRFIATLDRRTSATCREHDGHVYELDEYSPGSTAPPLHPNCRSTISGSLYGPDKKKTGTRIARNDKGKTYYVPADMTYKEWEKLYVHKSMTIQEWNDTHKAGISKSILGSTYYKEIVMEAKNRGIAYNAVHPWKVQPDEQTIITRLAGGDRTGGSCSSLAFAYAGNMNGLDVLDFRGGDSQMLFAQNDIIAKVCHLKGVDAAITHVKKEIAGTIDLLNNLTVGKTYYLAVGKHAAIVRNTGNALQYLELQSGFQGYSNGWHDFGIYGSISETLKTRFGCRKTVGGDAMLIDIESLRDNIEFQDILGYINTDEAQQQKGSGGHVK